MSNGNNFEILRNEFAVILKNSFAKNDISSLQEAFDSKKDVDVKSVLDQVFRDLLLNIILESDVEILQTYVMYCIQTCRVGMTTSTMPVVLLGDIFDALTLDKCEQMFAFVENGVQIWKEEQFFSACKNNLLRMCNDLLRRLSRSQNTVFCGRILLFLAKFFPFSERSGLNIVSEFNLDNLTEFGTDSTQSLKDSLEAESELKTENEKVKIDYNLYCKFWALQDFFRNPNQCYNKVQWKIFASHATNVLMAFSSYKLDEVQRNKIKLDSDVLLGSLSDEQETHYFAKYLTNQKLLELQLSDSNFRRYVLVQFLILFQYLNCSVKFKSEGYELKLDQREWVTNTMTDMVYGLLAETPPDGRAFCKSVKHILAREEHWNAWKNDGCPEFKKPVYSTSADDNNVEKRRSLKPKKPKRLLGDLMKEAHASNKFIMGNTELTKLWNLCPDNLEACKAKDRDFLPSLESYFAEAIEQNDPNSMIEDKYKKVNDGNFGWRALRLLARRSPHFFTHNNNPINKLPEYLEIMIQKIAKDKPDRNNQESENDTQNDPEMEVELLKDTETDDQTADQDETPLKSQDESQNLSDPAAEGQQHTVTISETQLDAVSIKIDKHWLKLAAKFGYRSDEVTFFASQHDSDPLRCRHMLVVWFTNDDDASIENLAYILEGLGLNEAAQCLK